MVLWPVRCPSLFSLFVCLKSFCLFFSVGKKQRRRGPTGPPIAGYNDQEMAAQLEAGSTKTTNTTSSQAPHKEELVIGTNISAYLMRKLTIEEEDTVKRALSQGALLPSIINQKELLKLAGRKGGGKLNTNIINMFTQVVLKQCDKKLCLQEQERRQSLFYGSECWAFSSDCAWAISTVCLQMMITRERSVKVLYLERSSKIISKGPSFS